MKTLDIFKIEPRNLGSYKYIFNQHKFWIPQCVQTLKDSIIMPKESQGFRICKPRQASNWDMGAWIQATWTQKISSSIPGLPGSERT